jgi:Lipocalin-like domain
MHTGLVIAGMKPGITVLYGVCNRKGPRMTKDDLVGVYRTLGDDMVAADGKVTSDNARTAQIMYSPDGYMAVVSMPNGRKLAAKTSGGPDLNAATPEERAEAAKGMVCYAGHYELKDGVLHHHVEMALNPNAVGQTIIRRPELNGVDLTLSSLPAPDGSYRRIRWRRVGPK